MSTTINTNYSSYPTKGLSYLLDSSSSTASTISTSSSDDLASLLDANMGADDTGSYVSNALASVATVDSMENASSPLAKLNLAEAVAQKVNVQSSASSRTDNASRVGTLISQSSSVLNAVSDAVGEIQKSDSTGNVLSAYQDTISSTLDSINDALKDAKNLVASNKSSDSATSQATISSLDSLGCSIAKKAGVTWTSVTGVAANTVNASSTTSSQSSSLIDFLA